MRDARMDGFGPAKTPAWVTRLRQAAIGSEASESTEAGVLNLAASVVPDEPAWAQEAVRPVAVAPERGVQAEAPGSVDRKTSGCHIG